MAGKKKPTKNDGFYPFLRYYLLHILKKKGKRTVFFFFFWLQKHNTDELEERAEPLSWITADPKVQGKMDLCK